jgi:hypothetical protein
MVLPALVSLKNLIKTKSYHIDLPFFRLHYQATVCLLLAFCLILTAKVLFGETIKCQSRMSPDGNSKFQDNLCYAIGTFTSYKVRTDVKPIDSINVTFLADPNVRYIHTGIPLGTQLRGSNVKVFWHNYYQYVPLILFIQAVFFYFPHYLWKLWENGIIASICKRLHEHRFSPNEYFDNNYDIICYIRNVLKFNKSLVYKYYFCHVLCLLNLLIQIVALNIIFNYQFVTYGYVVIRYMLNKETYGLLPASPNQIKELQLNNLNNPMDLIFPKVTECYIEVASQAGLETANFRPLCILPLNILHDKFFLLLWFWFVILLVLTAIQIINDFMFTMLPIFRRYLFTKRFGSSLFDVTSDDLYTRSPASLQELFLLNIVGHNTDKFCFSALLRRLNKEDCTASPSENQSVV